MSFKKAERKKVKLRLGIAGLSGTGKTWSALEIASGLSGKIALLDSESGRGELYSESFEYDVMQIAAPFSPDKYIAAIKLAEKEGYDILIIDSLSHAWSGDGGVLSIAEREGGQFQNGWRKATPKHNALIESIITANMHIIFTMRSKAEYIVEINEKGKSAPRKIGLAPIQRDGLEYECTIYLDMNHEHIAHVTKDNTKLYDQQFIQPTKQMGENLKDWLNSGKDLPEDKTEEIKTIFDIQEHLSNMDNSEIMPHLQSAYAKAYKQFKDDTENLSRLNECKDRNKARIEMLESIN